MTFSSGSLILVDYTAKIKETDKVFDTTIEDDAIKHHIDDVHSIYMPKLISINDISYPVMRGLDEALANMSVGDKQTIEIPPEKAFGLRDPNKSRMIPIRKLGDDADRVSVGDTIDIDQKTGVIRFIGSGRVKVDYNHKYAGQTIIYDVNVVQSLDTPHDKITNILKTRFTEDFIVFDLQDTELHVAIPENLHESESLSFIKSRSKVDIFKFVPTLEKIHFVETHLNKNLKSSQDESSQDETKSL